MAVEAAPTTHVFQPTADAYVNAAHPSTNYGTSSTLRSDYSPDLRSYLRFSVLGIGTDTVTRATLRLYANGSSPTGYQVYVVTGSWTEDDTAPSPDLLRQWIDTVDARLAEGKLVLVHDRAGRGRMGFWDAVYWMQRGLSAAEAVEDRYLAKGLDFQGAKIGCADGGNGQVQALSEIGQILTGVTYYPQVDEYGTAWPNCPRPSYMDGWDYQVTFAP